MKPYDWKIDVARLVATLTGIGALAVLCSLQPPAYGADDEAALRKRLESLSQSEQQQLLRNQQRFNELPPEEQQKLRDLHAALSTDPDGPRLREILEHYHEWLKTLSPEQRAELLDLDPEARVERIRRLVERQREEQERRRSRFAPLGPRLPREDARIIYSWFEDLVWQHRDELLARIPESRRQQIDKLDEPRQRRHLVGMELQSWRTGRSPIRLEQMEAIAPKLSAQTRERLDQADAQQKRRLARELVTQAIFSRMGGPFSRRASWVISNEDLERFYETDLRREDRERLLNLPPEQMRDELRQLYWQQMRRGAGPPPPPPEDRRGGRPDRPFGPRGEGRTPPDGDDRDWRRRREPPPFRGPNRADDDRPDPPPPAEPEGEVRLPGRAGGPG